METGGKKNFTTSPLECKEQLGYIFKSENDKEDEVVVKDSLNDDSATPQN